LPIIYHAAKSIFTKKHRPQLNSVFCYFFDPKDRSTWPK